ncbi:MAG: hypothetical protein ACO1RX_17665 [Candidatus Sericytochromatia bacterium]
MRPIKVVLGVTALLMLTACQDPIEKVISQNLEGLKKQDVEMVMQTVDTQSPSFDATRTQVTRLLQDYNLDFQIESMDIIKKPMDEKKEIAEAKAENQDTTGLDEAIEDFITEEERADAEQKKRAEAIAKAQQPLVAVVKVVQVTRSKDSNAKPFLDNRVQVVHTLYKYPTDENPEWKIFSSDIRAVEPILNKG